MSGGDVHEPTGGAKVGRYELLKKLAAGGMAEIYLARVTGVGGFSKDVVLKRILPQLAESEQFFRMFLDEARIAATLAHPNIVQVHDAGETDGQYYIAMEYLDGADLATLRRHLSEFDKRIALPHLVYITSCVCAGLHYAHEKRDRDGDPLGIVHRDVTPQNIFVTRDGGVKLVDFGIAKASNRLSRTTYGTMKGKLAYMAPEQCQGEEVDRRGDVYALGIVLYELSTGTNPHHGAAEYAIMKEIVEGTIEPPRTLEPNYPPELEAIVMKAIAKHPDARYQSAREFQVALEAYIRSQQLPVSALILADYIAPLHDAIKAEQDSRAQRFADELGAYEDYLATKPPAEPKRRKRAEDAAADDAAAAAASIDGLLQELRQQDDASPQEIPRSERPTVAPRFDIPGEPIGLANVNVRTGSRAVGIAAGVVLGLGGLFAYLVATGKLNLESSDKPSEEVVEVERAPNVPDRGVVEVESSPAGAAVWQLIGLTPIKRRLIDSGSTHHFRIVGEGYNTGSLEIGPSDWRGGGGSREASTEIILSREGQMKAVQPVWSEPYKLGEPSGEAGLLTIRSPVAGLVVWKYVGATPTLELKDVSTRSAVELRVESSGYRPSFVEVTERDYTQRGRAEVKVTLAR